MRVASRVPYCVTICLSLGCAGAVPVAEQVAVHVAPIVVEFLLGKAMEALWDANTGRLQDPDRVRERLARLEDEMRKIDPQYASPIAELRGQIKEGMTWEEYKVLAKGTEARVEAIDARVRVLEQQAKQFEADIAGIKGRLDKVERAAVAAKGYLVLKTSQPIITGANVWVEVDGQRADVWQVGTTEVRLTLTPGTHRVAVHSIYTGNFPAYAGIRGINRTISDEQVVITANETSTHVVIPTGS
jgi:hypothetical protein